MGRRFHVTTCMLVAQLPVCWRGGTGWVRCYSVTGLLLYGMKLSWRFRHDKNCPRACAAGQPVLWKRDLDCVLKLCVPARIMLSHGYAFDVIAWTFGPLCRKLCPAGIDVSPLRRCGFCPSATEALCFCFSSPWFGFSFQKPRILFFVFSKVQHVFFFFFHPSSCVSHVM